MIYDTLLCSLRPNGIRSIRELVRHSNEFVAYWLSSLHGIALVTQREYSLLEGPAVIRESIQNSSFFIAIAQDPE